MQVAFVTYSKLPGLSEDDKLLAQYLSQKNIIVSPAIWDDRAINWQQFDVIILRSMWDYFERPAEFDQWIDQLKQLNCYVLNPLSVVKWNQNKNYFDNFSKKGILLPPYVICKKNSNNTLKEIMDTRGWSKAVVKPAISGGAYHTWIVNNVTDADETRFSALLQTGDVIVQLFAEEIITKGELSLIFFNKRFSHAICKKAKPGDFRVQSQFGGTEKTIEPGKTILNQAADLLNKISEPLLYARVDGIETDDGRFLLMELELIEPSLFLSSNDRACENFYTALTEILRAREPIFIGGN